MTVQDLLPNDKGALNEDATYEEALGFFESCMGETVSIAFNIDHKSGEKKYSLRTVTSKLIASSLLLREDKSSFKLELQLENGEKLNIVSSSPYRVKKCLPSLAHLF